MLRGGIVANPPYGHLKKMLAEAGSRYHFSTVPDPCSRRFRRRKQLFKHFGRGSLFLRDLRNITLGDLLLLWFHLGIAEAFLVIGFSPSPRQIPQFSLSFPSAGKWY